MNKAMISPATFGRLSCLAAEREDVLGCIDVVQSSNQTYTTVNRRYLPGFASRRSPISLDAVFARALPTLLEDLNSIVEAIVLADEFLVFCGYPPEFVDEVVVQGYQGAGARPGAFVYTQVWPEEANKLMDGVLSEVPNTYVGLPDKKLFIADLALDYPHRALTAVPMVEALSSDGIDFAHLTSVDPGDLWYGTQLEIEAVNKMISFMDGYLGDEWRVYNEHVRPLPSWPPELLRPLSAFSATHALQFKLGLYAEFRAALAHGTISVSSIHMGRFYSLLASRTNIVNGSLRDLVVNSYNKLLRKQLEEHGIACLDLQLPPLLRICLVGSTNISDVLRRAVLLRKESRFIHLRNYLSELANQDNPMKLLRSLKKLQDWIDLDLRGISDLSNGSIALSGTSSGPMSLISREKQVLAWRNPAVLIQSRLKALLKGRNNMTDLARVLQVEPRIAAQAIAKTEFKGSR
jgi:hypothetical protein